MNEELMRTRDIGALLGHSSPASTRKWIFNRKLKARGRDLETGEKLYSRDAVLKAKAEEPGQGARTDLRKPAPDEGTPHDHDGVPDTD